MSTLKIFTLTEKQDGTIISVPFPNEVEQAEICDYEYTANRMGGAPSLTAKISYSYPLDDLWNEKQYVEFNGVRLFVRDTPNGKIDNSTGRYEHEITFLHERFVLENVYMLDSVYTDGSNPDNQPNADKYVSNSTKVIFWGDINEFVSRFNACLLAANLGGKADGNGYYVVVDDGVKSDELLISFEDKYFSEALQEIYNTYKLPYYWEGKVCHIGTAPAPISEIFEYGEDNALLSIEKTNTNQGYFNRATGTGSSDNIPNYYPRTTSPNTTVPVYLDKDDNIIETDIHIIDQTKFEKLESVVDEGYPWKGQGIKYGGGEESVEFDSTGVDFTKHWGMLKVLKEAKYQLVANLPNVYDEAYYPHYKLIPGKTHYRDGHKDNLWLNWDEMFGAQRSINVETEYTSLGAVTPIGVDGASGSVYGYRNSLVDLKNEYKKQNPNAASRIDAQFAQHYECYNTTLYSAPGAYTVIFFFKKKNKGKCALINFRFSVKYGNKVVYLPSSDFRVCVCNANGEKTADLDYVLISPISGTDYTTDGFRNFTIKATNLDNLEDEFWLRVYFRPENYTIYTTRTYRADVRSVCVNNEEIRSNCPDSRATIKYIEDEYNPVLNSICYLPPDSSAIPDSWEEYGHISLSDVYRTLADFGLQTSYVPKQGDRVVRKYVSEELNSVPTQSVLMPSIYRRTRGIESFYNALNEQELLKDEKYSPFAELYKNEDGGYREFEHEYIAENPREIKYDFPDIKPTIDGIEGVAGALNNFIEVAFDNNDHDFLISDSKNDNSEEYADSISSDSQYAHPYFFAKVPQTKIEDEEGRSFNLFDATSENEMTISMKSGDCGGCQFKIMSVDIDGQKKNPILTDEDGNLRRDKNGRVMLFGASNAQEYGIDETQQDTSQKSTWLCLLKETDTYGILMPNAASKFRPTAGEKFVYLNINLPILYIKEAEDRLSNAIIEQMQKDNTEKYTFSIRFSRVYLAENPNIANLIDENACINVRYNGNVIPLYVNSYSVKQSSSDSLSEISVDLKDEISISSRSSQNRQSSETMSVLSAPQTGGSNPITIITTDEENIEPSDSNVYSASRVDNQFVSKDREETISAKKTFNAGISVSGELSAERASVNGILEVGEYEQGLVGALKGLRVTNDGKIYASSLYLEQSLSVPTIDFNRAMVMNGIFIISPSVGEIVNITYEPLKDDNGNALYQRVDENYYPLFEKNGEYSTDPLFGVPAQTTENTNVPLYANKGIASLKLEDGEYGSIKEGDMLLGFWHGNGVVFNNDFDGVWNAQEKCYDRNGNYGMAGFSSVYFLVTKILETDSNNGSFEYELRSATDPSWQLNVHPQVGMKFYGFGNIQDKSRQSLYIITRDYSVRLINKHEWTYDASNVIEIHGLLEGFSMIATGKDGKPYTKRFHGYGNVEGNSYIFGQIDQFERLAYNISVSSNGDNLINSTETKTLKCTVFNGYNNDVTTDVSEWKVVRHTDDENDDKTWNNNHISFDGELSITSADIGVGEKASFAFTVVMADGLQTTTTVVIRKVLSDTDFGDGYTMEIDTGGDSLIAYGETKTLTCTVKNALMKDVTDEVQKWQVVRDSGDKASDTAWLLKDKVKAFNGTIDVVYSDEENDLGTATSAKFIFTATIGEEEVQAILEI